ncbi:hypothetical protein ADL15_04860 [Actinoplanes awajinensis subsp. mycoplanecinus]|uniref:PBS lyase n=1 Tax=Actinoplanes awajinensis subsp. mycoplanecinus TaxID=135947 RepID=A0A0X3VA61_9ACTN|nr:hypothetical protein ADL15_04860 [Actinoplanes awajinensis subsp. mycoplanecinus]
MHERPIRVVFDRVAPLLSDGDAGWRFLAARILGQLGPQTDGRRPFSAETVPMLRERLGRETDAYVLGAIVSALAAHHAGEALDEVLGMADHPAVGVRFAVAAGLPGLVTLTQVEPAAAAALIRLCHDEDADIRFYAVYAATKEIAGLDLERIADLAAQLVTDPDQQVRTMAIEHLAAIPAVRGLLNAWDFRGVFDPEDNTRSYDCLIRPMIVGLDCGADAAYLRELLDDELRRHFGVPAGTVDTEGVAGQLIAWRAEAGE